MEECPTPIIEGEHPTTRSESRFVTWWTAGLAVMYLCGGAYGVNLLREYATETANRRKATIEAVTADRTSIPADAKPLDVQVSLRMNRFGEFSLRESGWSADFDIAFRWTGSGPNPGETFRLANGQILQREKGVSFDKGEEHYAEYRVLARIVKSFDSSRFPFSDEPLAIEVEDATRRLTTLRYVEDKQNTGVRPESIPRNLKLTRTLSGVTTRPAGGAQGEIGSVGKASDSYSLYFLAILVAPGSIGMYLKLFQALFASVALSLLALFIKPTHVDCRFGLPVGGFFASVANNLYVSTVIPDSSRLTLTDMINTVSLVTIFLVLVQSVISLHIYDTQGRERFSRIFDLASVVVFVAGYAGVNLALPIAARPL